MLNGIDTKAGNTALLLQIQLEERQPYLENQKILLLYFYHRNVLFCMRYSHNITIFLFNFYSRNLKLFNGNVI